MEFILDSLEKQPKGKLLGFFVIIYSQSIYVQKLYFLLIDFLFSSNRFVLQNIKMKNENHQVNFIFEMIRQTILY